MHKQDEKINTSQINHRYVNSFRMRKGVVVSLALLLLVFALPSLTFAAIAVILTDDTEWDSNWGTPMQVDAVAGPAGYDIDTFWVNTDSATPSVYYFGLTTHGSLAADALVYFWIDCNDNGSFTDNVDRVLEYDPFNDWVTEYSGDEALVELGPLSDPNGEVIGGNQVEAQTNNTGSVDWSGCQAANHEIKAEIWNNLITNVPDNSPSQSGTAPRVYDIPTAVSLTSVGVKTEGMSMVLLALVIAGSLVGATVWMTRNRQEE